MLFSASGFLPSVFFQKLLHPGNKCRAVHSSDNDRVLFGELRIAVKVSHGFAARDASLAFYAHTGFFCSEKAFLHRIKHGGRVMHGNAGQAKLC